MTRINKALAAIFAVVLITGFSSSSFAQSNASASANADARIVAGITIAKTTDLAFGQIVRSVDPGAVVLDPVSNQRSATGGVTLGQNAGFHAAEFAVTGEPAYAFQLTLPTSIAITRNNGSETMAVDNFTSSLGTGDLGTLDANGAKNFTLGATLHIAGSQATGTYVGSFAVTASYQ